MLRTSWAARGICDPHPPLAASRYQWRSYHSSFHHGLCDKIIEFDSETVDEIMPKSRKAFSDWSENRDTCHPELVTEWLMTTLAAIGSLDKVTEIQKRTRDDVLWIRCCEQAARVPMHMMTDDPPKSMEF